ncbi:hypothetical protein [Listeria monocytogenes]
MDNEKVIGEMKNENKKEIDVIKEATTSENKKEGVDGSVGSV